MTRIQADPLPRLRAWLDTEIADAAVRLDLPDGWTVKAGTVIVLADDGGPFVYPVKSQHTIRVTVWGAGRTEARRLAAVAAGLLHDAHLPGITLSRNGSAVLEAVDPTTGARLASTLLTAHVKTQEV